MLGHEPPGGVGVLGGAFNPPHLGHLILAQEAIHQLRLQRLVVVPTGRAPHKRIEPDPGAEIRLELARRAFEGMERVEISATEVEREGPSYAYRTLELIADEVSGSRLTFVMGADAAAGLGEWEQPQRVLELARLAVADRAAVESGAVEAEASAIDRGAEVLRIEMPEVAISSTELRDRARDGRPLKWLTADAVIEAIEARVLYTDGEADGGGE